MYMVIAELRFRKSKSWQRDEKDDRSTTRMTAAYVFSNCFGIWPLLAALDVFSAPSDLLTCTISRVVLFALMFAGMALRYHSMSTLGAFFSRTLRIDSEEHRLIDTGAYAYVRHPGYTANLMVFASNTAVCTGSFVAVALHVAIFAPIYWRRTSAEEAMLKAGVAGYSDYCQRTHRFVPFVF
jgi:protein-S-isoprenylcysteine O-methyltransferase Ste14